MKNIVLESKIIQSLREDNVRNNTIHFIWDRVPITPCDFILKVITHNPDNGQNFLLKEIFADSKHQCMVDMLEYVNDISEKKWNVVWIDKNGNKNESHFRGKDEEEIKNKFFYDKTKSTIEEISLITN